MPSMQKIRTELKAKKEVKTMKHVKLNFDKVKKLTESIDKLEKVRKVTVEKAKIYNETASELTSNVEKLNSQLYEASIGRKRGFILWFDEHSQEGVIRVIFDDPTNWRLVYINNDPVTGYIVNFGKPFKFKTHELVTFKEGFFQAWDILPTTRKQKIEFWSDMLEHALFNGQDDKIYYWQEKILRVKL